MFIQNGLQINDKKKYLNWIMRKILFKLIFKNRRRFSNEILKHVTEWVNGLLCQHNVSYCAFDWLASEMRHFNGDWLDDTSDDDLEVLLSVCVELQVRDEISHCSEELYFQWLFTKPIQFWMQLPKKYLHLCKSI